MFRYLMKVCIGLLLLNTLHAAPRLNQDYIELPKDAQSPTKTITIIEFFNFGCPACAHLETPLEGWLKQHPQVHFSRIPVVFHPEWVAYAKAFYVAKTLMLLPNATPAIFEAIQSAANPLKTEPAIEQWFIDHFKLDPLVVHSAFANPNILKNVESGMQLASQWQIFAIPAFVVNGTYETDLSRAKTPEHLLAILNALTQASPNAAHSRG